MDGLKTATSLAVLVVASLTGGVLLGVVRSLSSPRALAVLGLLFVLIAGLTIGVARSRRWLDSPYW